LPPPVPPERAASGLRALGLLLLLLATLWPAARARAQAVSSSPDSLTQAADTLARRASPFERVPLSNGSGTPHTWSYAAMGTGVTLIGASFLLGHRANETYAAYLRETDPARIEVLFDRSVLLDRSSSGSLLLGESLLCLGLYGRFLRRPTGPLAWSLSPQRCAVSYRY
jgi:hypothetical protein